MSDGGTTCGRGCLAVSAAGLAGTGAARPCDTAAAGTLGAATLGAAASTGIFTGRGCGTACRIGSSRSAAGTVGAAGAGGAAGAATAGDSITCRRGAAGVGGGGAAGWRRGSAKGVAGGGPAREGKGLAALRRRWPGASPAQAPG